MAQRPSPGNQDIEDRPVAETRVGRRIGAVHVVGAELSEQTSGTFARPRKFLHLQLKR
jgi:hypothetical protein